MSVDTDKAYIQAARSLGACLRRYAKDRREEDKKLIASLQHEIAQIHRHEESQQKATK